MPGACRQVVHYSFTIRIRVPAILTTHAKATIRQQYKTGYTNILNRGKDADGEWETTTVIILEWP